jgi:hypothetical protein
VWRDTWGSESTSRPPNAIMLSLDKPYLIEEDLERRVECVSSPPMDGCGGRTKMVRGCTRYTLRHRNFKCKSKW